MAQGNLRMQLPLKQRRVGNLLFLLALTGLLVLSFVKWSQAFGTLSSAH